MNPAAAVCGPKHVVTKGATPVLSPAEARKLLESIDTGALAGLRDRALLSVMLYSFARVSAVLHRDLSADVSCEGPGHMLLGCAHVLEDRRHPVADLQQENAALRESISRLSAAALRVSASLDLETVLREVVDATRELTRARYGAITTIDGAGAPENFLAAGFPPDQLPHLFRKHAGVAGGGQEGRGGATGLGECRRRAVQRVHAEGLQRRLLLRPRRPRLGRRRRGSSSTATVSGNFHHGLLRGIFWARGD